MKLDIMTHSESPPRSAVLLLDSWAGREEHAVEIIGETPARYRVRLLADAVLPGKCYRCHYRHAGEVVLVPKRAVRVDK